MVCGRRKPVESVFIGSKKLSIDWTIVTGRVDNFCSVLTPSTSFPLRHPRKSFIPFFMAWLPIPFRMI